MFKIKLKKLINQLYPTGRAFNIPKNGVLDKLHDGLTISQNQLIEDSLSIFDSILPDNDNFTADDATRWEERLGMITNESVLLSDRKSAIIRKMNHPGTILARQSWDYLQEQLQLAGFDLYVYENIPEQTVEQILQPFSETGQLGDGQLDDFELGDVFSVYPELFNCAELGDGQLGDFQLDECVYKNKIANNIDELKDIPFNIGQNYRSIFFIGGPVIGEFANVNEERKNEFRQLVLKIKPVQAIGILFINYTY